MNRKDRRSKANITFSHALIKNNLPSGVSTKDYNDLLSGDAEIKLGLFDTASPDFNRYYPDVSESDLVPDEDKDFTFPLVRALSKVIVNKYGPIDFGRGNVLRDSMPLLLGQTVYPNHEVSVGNELGAVYEVEWQNAKSQDGNAIPGGINARLKIDGKSNPKIARGMNMVPPSVHSFSVGVTFDWEKSHPNMEDSEFWRLLGAFAEDGKLVRKVVTEIIAYHELSTVPHGADPYAQIITEDGLNNPVYAQRVLKYPKDEVAKGRDNKKYTFNQFTENDYSKMGHFHDYSRMMSLEVEYVEDTIPKSNKSNNNLNESEMEEFLESLSQIEGLNLGEGATESQALRVVKKLAKKSSDDAETISELKAEVKEAKTELSEANSKLEKQESKVEAMDQVLKETKEEATRLYKLSKGENADTKMLEMIAGIETYETAKVMLNQFTGDAEESFSASCDDCGSSNVSRQASQQSQGEVDPKGDTDDKKLGEGNQVGSQQPKPKTLDEAFQAILSSKQTAGADIIHGKVKKDNN